MESTHRSRPHQFLRFYVRPSDARLIICTLRTAINTSRSIHSQRIALRLVCASPFQIISVATKLTRCSLARPRRRPFRASTVSREDFCGETRTASKDLIVSRLSGICLKDITLIPESTKKLHLIDRSIVVIRNAPATPPNIPNRKKMKFRSIACSILVYQTMSSPSCSAFHGSLQQQQQQQLLRQQRQRLSLNLTPQDLTDYMAKANEAKVQAMKQIEDKKNAEIKVPA